MTGTFKANTPANNFLLLLYGFVLKISLFIYTRPPALQSSDGPLYRSFIIWLSGVFSGSSVVFGFITFILLFVQAIAFNKLVNDQRMFQKPGYLVGMSYLLITSLFSEWFSLSAALIVNTILIWVWVKLCTLHNNGSAKTTIYNLGLGIGAACFIYYPSIIFTLLFIVGIAITRPFKLNEWLIGLIGICTPFYFFASWLFLTGQINTYQMPALLISRPLFAQYQWAIAAIVAILLSMSLGFFFIQNNMRRQIVQTRKSWQLIYLYLLTASVVPFVNASAGFTNWILAAVPASLLVSSAFYYPDKKWFPFIIHWGMVLISLTIVYFVN
ncbi:MAG: hypothetical protein H7X88_01265 [Gloeobacteraceae cyanobacterium ES-bin-316]|nr:hypothetical protein [Ferruginibacter sp.]